MEITRISTRSFYAEPQGASWIIRWVGTGEVFCIRPDMKSAADVMDLVEEGKLPLKEEK